MENRYDKYKDSGIAWIGEIPEHWEVIKIKNAFNIISGATPKTDNMAYWDGEITWITPADYNTEDKIISSGKRNITLAGLNSCGTSIVPEGSIIFSKRAPIGLVAINVVPLCTNQGCISCIPKPSVNTKYFYYLMSVLTEWFELFGSGTTFKELSTNNFANFILSQPLILEQQSIAAYLDQKCGEIDELITLQEEMITKLQSYKQSVITEAVTKGLNKNVPLKDSGIEWIGKIPEHWTLKRIKNICDNLDYLREPISAEHRSRNNPIYDYYGASGVIDKIDFYNVDDQVLLIGEDGANLVMRNLPLVYKANGKFWVNNHAHILKPKNDNYDFCAYAFEAADYSLFITGSAQPKLSQENLGRIKIAIPPFLEQQAIVNYLDKRCSEIDELISIKQQKIEKLKEYKKSLIFECVTGKRKVS